MVPAQKIFRFDPRQTQHFRNLVESQGLIAIALKRQGFQGAARDISTVGGKALSHIVRNAKNNFHILKFNMRGLIIPSAEVRVDGAGGIHTQPMIARILARTSASSSADTVPFRFAFRTRQSRLFT